MINNTYRIINYSNKLKLLLYYLYHFLCLCVHFVFPTNVYVPHLIGATAIYSLLDCNISPLNKIQSLSCVKCMYSKIRT